MVITMLGVMMFSGLQAACQDLRVSADEFFDAQNLHDLSIVSTLGFDDDDLSALRNAEGIRSVQGIYSEECSAVCGDTELSVTLTTIGTEAINMPYVKEGKLPEKINEAAVTERFVKDTGAKTGEKIIITGTVDEETESRILNREFVITAVVTDVRNVNNPFGSVAYRDASIAGDTVFVMNEAAESGLYTQAEILLEGTDELFCFSSAYKDRIEEVKKTIEDSIRTDRENARTEKIKEDARKEVREAEEEILKELQKAKEELENGEKEIRDGKSELDQNAALLEDGRRTAEKALADAQRLIDENYALLIREQENFEKTKADLLKQIEDLRKNREDLIQARDGLKEIDDGLKQLDEGIAQLEDEQVVLFIDLLRGLDEETPLSDLFDGIEQVGTVIENLQEAGIEIDEETIHEASAEILALVKGAEEDHEILHHEETLAFIEVLKTLDDETSMSETGESCEELAEVIRKYDPLNDLKSVSTFLSGYENALERNAYVIDIVSREEGKQLIAMLEMINETENIEGSFDEMSKQLSDMPGLLAEIAGSEEPETVGELISVYETALAKLKTQREELVELRKSITDQLAENGIEETGIDDAIAQIDDGIRQIEEGIAYGEAEIAAGFRQLEEAQAQLNSSRFSTLQQLNDALAQIMDGYAQLREARKKLEEGWEEYREGEKEASEEIADAYKTIDDIDKAAWYIRDRAALSSYANIESDAECIESIGTVFPVVFLVVSILISLTGITRMVEEERGLIGTYKSLGYSNFEIMAKYLVYGAAACLLGSLFGTLLAFIGLPLFIFTIFSIMYLLPFYRLSFLPLYGILGPLLFLAATLGAVYFAANSELTQVPASLMRPKAPKAGSRVFLEKWRTVWTRMSFLDKVTARNLFRYKKRMLMTVFGIAGCMALLLFGFAIGDSVRDLVPRQYEQTFLYDMLCAAQGEEHEKLDEAVAKDPGTESYIDLMISEARVSYGNSRQESLTLFVFDDEEDLSEYIIMHHHGQKLEDLKADSVYVTVNAANVLGFEKGSTIHVETADLETADVCVNELCENYLGNYMYMTRSTFEKNFDGYMKNGKLINLKADADEETYKDMLKSQPKVMNVLSSQDVENQFEDAFLLINVVVYIIIVMSAALAFVVLFTLSSINVSERTREIATIKVLGFFDGEVHTYIDRETLILTCIGILIGIPLGYAFAQTLTIILNLPSMYLAVSLHLKSYFIAAGLSFGFALCVNVLSDRYLDVIDPVTALKSVE